MALSAFKAYDIRGRVGEDLDEDLAFRVGRAFVEVMDPGAVVIGRDIRESSASLMDALARGVCAAGADVLDIGLCGTEEVYFATDHLGAGGGLMVTASHNPIGDNGIKLIGRGARPISRASGLDAIEALVEGGAFTVAGQGTRKAVDMRAEYVARVLSFVDPVALAPLRVLVNAGNGAAGPTFDAIAKALAAAGGKVSRPTTRGSIACRMTWMTMPPC